MDGGDRMLTKFSDREQILMQENQSLREQIMAMEQMASEPGGTQQGEAPPPPGINEAGPQGPMEGPTPGIQPSGGPSPLISNGGPLGPTSDDVNALAQLAQLQALDQQGGGM